MAMAMPVTLDVLYKTGQDPLTNKFFLEATVTRNEIIPPYIFLFKMGLDAVAMFCAVASVADLETYPSNAPGCDGIPFFLKDTVRLEFDSAVQMRKVLDQIKKYIEELVCSYKILLSEISAEETVTYIADC